MFNLIEMIKAIFLGILEGITEWLPISSTGHLILADAFVRLDQSDAFKEMFFVVIQLSAILAVLLLFWPKLNPLARPTAPVVAGQPAQRLDHAVLSLWVKILVACIPAAVIGLLFDDAIDALFYNYQTVSVTLILYGILFIVIERWNEKRQPTITSLAQISYRTALTIGVFQLLALIPGTSRSGATIIGAMLIGTSRAIAAEFTFFLAIPVMFGASLVKLLKFGFDFTSGELLVLVTGMVVSFLASILAIKFLMSYVKKHDFKIFGWYRIGLGILIMAIFALLS